MPPDVVVTPFFAFAMNAATTFETSLNATATASDRLTAVPPTAAPIETAAVSDVIVEVSWAVAEMLAALIPLGITSFTGVSVGAVSPSMYAWTCVWILFTAPEPAPVSATPVAPTATATEPATTMASIAWLPVAVSISAPVAFTREFLTYACTCSAASDRPTSCHDVTSP